jgi:hypothetical protein
VSGLRPDDRVLLIRPVSPERASEAALSVPRGLVVVLDEPAAVEAGRTFCRDLPNVLFVTADGHYIPWSDGFFSIVEAPGDWSQREVERVAAPGARIRGAATA